ncbi:MAG: hypothetical protein ABSD59_02475 [Terracidiphilus sp.]|jgi:hypothetical protein
MTNEKFEILELHPESLGAKGASNEVTIKNNTERDALLIVSNAFWGPVSLGYARAGKSVALPTIVNVDAFAKFQDGSGVFVQWDSVAKWRVFCEKKKINLTPGQTYSLSDFDNC